MSNADNANFPNFLRGSLRGQSSCAPASEAHVMTERKFGRRVSNLLLPERAPPHLASETAPGISALQTTSLSVPTCKPNSCHGMRCFQRSANLHFYAKKVGIGVNGGIAKHSKLRDYFTHPREFHASWFRIFNLIIQQFWSCFTFQREVSEGEKAVGPSLGEDSRTFSERGSPSHLQLSPVLRNFPQAAPLR